jgi:hypothetical protein
MALVECVLGPANPYVAGHQVDFQRDARGRYVAQVDDLKALACLLSVEHYKVVKETAEDEAPQGVAATADDAKPAKRGRSRGASPAAQASDGDTDIAPGIVQNDSSADQTA